MNKSRNNIASFKQLFTWIIINNRQKRRTADYLKFLCKPCIQTKIDCEAQKNSDEKSSCFSNDVLIEIATPHCKYLCFIFKPY